MVEKHVAAVLKAIVQGATQRFTQCTLYIIYAAVFCIIAFGFAVHSNIPFLAHVFAYFLLGVLFVGLTFQLMLIRDPFFCSDARVSILHANLESRYGDE